jgi:hypothetical protein
LRRSFDALMTPVRFSAAGSYAASVKKIASAPVSALTVVS